MTSGVRTAPAPVENLWARPATAVTVVAGGGIVSGGVWALAMPRGPVDAGSGLALMVTGLLLGALAGLVLRRRRTMLVVLLAHVPSGEMPSNLFVEEYDLVQKVRALPATADTFAVLDPQVQGIDFRTQAAQLQVPVYVVSGEFEARGRIGLAREWFDVLIAPDKRWIELPRSGHRPHFEQPDAFAAVMRTVLAETG